MVISQSRDTTRYLAVCLACGFHGIKQQETMLARRKRKPLLLLLLSLSVVDSKLQTEYQKALSFLILYPNPKHEVKKQFRTRTSSTCTHCCSSLLCTAVEPSAVHLSLNHNNMVITSITCASYCSTIEHLPQGNAHGYYQQ